MTRTCILPTQMKRKRACSSFALRMHFLCLSCCSVSFLQGPYFDQRRFNFAQPETQVRGRHLFLIVAHRTDQGPLVVHYGVLLCGSWKYISLEGLSLCRSMEVSDPWNIQPSGQHTKQGQKTRSECFQRGFRLPNLPPRPFTS